MSGTLGHHLCTLAWPDILGVLRVLGVVGEITLFVAAVSSGRNTEEVTVPVRRAVAR
jgi:hypothetical protein